MPPFRGFCRHLLLPGRDPRTRCVQGLSPRPFACPLTGPFSHAPLVFSRPRFFFCLGLALGAPLDCLTLIWNIAFRELFREYPRTIRELVEMRSVPSIPPTPRLSWFFTGCRGKCCPFLWRTFFGDFPPYFGVFSEFYLS